MKNFILLATLILAFISVSAQGLNKERKMLVDAIKTSYSSWELAEASKDSISDKSNEGKLLASIAKTDYESEAKLPKPSFKDFTFKIGDCQAVVEFQVDFKKYSVFMEKENGHWKLVCAAELPVN